MGRAPKWRQSRLPLPPLAAAVWGSKDDGGLRPEGDEEVTEDGGEVSESKPELPPDAAASQLVRAPAVVQAAASCKLPPAAAVLVMMTSEVR